MEERIVKGSLDCGNNKSSLSGKCPDGKKSDRVRFWLGRYCWILLWLLCGSSWVALGLYRFRLHDVEERLSSLEDKLNGLGALSLQGSSAGHLQTYVKSVIRQVRWTDMVVYFCGMEK